MLNKQMKDFYFIFHVFISYELFDSQCDHTMMFSFVCYQISMFTTSPIIRAKIILYARYSAKFLAPRTIFSAPRLLIFVAGPVNIKEAALPTLIPSHNHCCSKGIVPPATSIEWNSNGRRHKYAPGFIAAEQIRHKFLRDVSLEQR